MIFCKGSRNRVIAMAMLGILVGSVILMTAPGMIYRTQGTVGFSVRSLVTNLTSFAAAPFILMVVASVSACLSSTCMRRVIFHSQAFIIFFISALASLVMLICTDVGPRGGIWMSFVSVVGLLWILRNWFGETCYFRNLPVLVAATLMLAAVFARLIVVDKATVEYRKSFLSMLKWYASGGEGSYFGDYKTVSTRPLLSGYLPDYGVNEYNNKYLSEYYRRPSHLSGTLPLVIPAELRRVDGETGIMLGGDMGLRCVDGYYYFPIDNQTYQYDWNYMAYFDADFGSGYSREVFWVFPFRSVGDGNFYLWLTPWRGWCAVHFLDLKGLRNPKITGD